MVSAQLRHCTLESTILNRFEVTYLQITALRFCLTSSARNSTTAFSNLDRRMNTSPIRSTPSTHPLTMPGSNSSPSSYLDNFTMKTQLSWMRKHSSHGPFVISIAGRSYVDEPHGVTIPWNEFGKCCLSLGQTLLTSDRQSFVEVAPALAERSQLSRVRPRSNSASASSAMSPNSC